MRIKFSELLLPKMICTYKLHHSVVGQHDGMKVEPNIISFDLHKFEAYKDLVYDIQSPSTNFGITKPLLYPYQTWIII